MRGEARTRRKAYVPLDAPGDERTPYARAVRLVREDVDEEHPQVRQLMEEAAEAGDPRAAYVMATWFLLGTCGYPSDDLLAVTLLRRSAEAGVREAMHDLAVAYSFGRGVERDDVRAFVWYLRAAIRGDREAILQVANAYATGTGTDIDEGSALAWYEYAEALGFDDGQAEAYRRWLEGVEPEA